MPTFNAIEYVDASILSLLAQSFREFRVLAYDDHSDDGTFERLQFWQRVDERITVSRPFSSHSGYIELLNQGIEDSNAQYIARMDADDISIPRRLELQFSFLESTPTAVLVGSQGENIIQNERVRISTDYPWESQFVNPVSSYTHPVNDAMMTRHRVIHGSMFMRRAEVKQVGGYDPELEPIEDWDLSLKLGQRGEVYVIPEVLYLRRIHDMNVSKLHPNKERAVGIIKSRYGIQVDVQSTRPTHL